MASEALIPGKALVSARNAGHLPGIDQPERAAVIERSAADMVLTVMRP